MTPARAFTLAVCWFALSLTSACVVIPHRGKVFGPAGKAGSVDLRFLTTGSTARDEVRSRLAMVDVKIPGDSLFWGRWRRKWDVYWLAAGGAETAATAGGGAVTIWRRRNILIEFDASGKISGYQTFGASELVSALSVVMRRAGVNDQMSGAELTLLSAEGERISFKEGMAYFAGHLAGTPKFTCGLDRLVNLKVSPESTEQHIRLLLEASVPGSARRKARWVFTLTPPEVYEFVKFAIANSLDRILVDMPAKEVR
jgi:hypothetical protein